MEWDNTPPAGATIASSGWSNSPAVAVPFTTSTTIYYGHSSYPNPTEGQAKSDLLATDKASVSGSYICAANGYKFLMVPLGVDAPTTIRDLATGWTLYLAGASAGYGTVTNGLNHASLVIDGVTYRVYRSTSEMGAEIILQVT